MNVANPSGWIARWVMTLSCYRLEIELKIMTFQRVEAELCGFILEKVDSSNPDSWEGQARQVMRPDSVIQVVSSSSSSSRSSQEALSWLAHPRLPTPPTLEMPVGYELLGQAFQDYEEVSSPPRSEIRAFIAISGDEGTLLRFHNRSLALYRT